MIAKRSLLILLYLIFLMGHIQAQTFEPGTDSKANNLASRAETSVNPSTGILTYSIPLLSLERRGFKLPVSLFYSASGIKVDQKGGVCGVGWGLEVGGSISRTVRGGKEDENPGGGRMSSISFNSNINYISLINQGIYDGESDLFTASFNGRTIKFLVSKNTQGIIQCIPLERNNLIVTLIGDQFHFDGFTITDEQGIIYKFLDKEIIQNLVYPQPNTTETIRRTEITSSWKLTDIIIPNEEIVHFDYEKQSFPEMRSSNNDQFYIYGKPIMVIDTKNPLHLGRINSIRADLKLFGGRSETYRSRVDNLLRLQHDSQERMNAFRTMIYDADTTNKVFFGVPNLGNSFLNQNELQNAFSSLLATDALLESLSKSLFSAYGDLYKSYTGITTNYFPRNYHSELRPLSIKSVKWGQKNITFDYNSGNEFEGKSKAITNIKLTNEVGQNIYNYELQYLDSIFGKSLLKGLIAHSRTDSQDLKYEFDYFRYGVNHGIDYWGFYTKKSNTTQLAGSIPNAVPITLPSPSSQANPNFYYNWYFDQTLTNINTNQPLFQIDPSALPEQFGGMVDRTPDSTAMLNLTLKSVTLPTGGKVAFTFEPNEIDFPYHPGIEDFIQIPNNLIIGGLRLKKIDQFDKNGLRLIGKMYKYRFSGINIYGNLVSDKSSGQIISKDKTGYIDELHYQGFLDYVVNANLSEPLGQFDEVGNNGVMYDYVEEIIPGSGRIGYRYLPFKDGFRNDIALHPFWLENLLVAKCYYDEYGKLVQLERNKYSISNMDVELATELLPGWAINENSRPFFNLIPQIRGLNYTLPSSTPGLYPDQNEEIFSMSVNDKIYRNPYLDYYKPNLEPRMELLTPNKKYNIFSGGKVLLAETELINFANPQSSSSIGQSLFSGYPKYDKYMYEWIAGIPNAKPIIKKNKYYYDNPLHDFITRTEQANGNNDVLTVKKKYVLDYSLPLSDPLSMLKDENKIAGVIEVQKWIRQPGFITDKLISGDLTEFQKISSGNSNLVLPSKVYKMELTSAIAPSSGGLTQTLDALPPYTSLFHDNRNIYKLDNTLKWKLTGNIFENSEIKEEHAGLNVSKYFNEIGMSILEVSGAKDQEIKAIDNRIGTSSLSELSTLPVRYYQEMTDNNFPDASDITKIDYYKTALSLFNRFKKFETENPALYQQVKQDEIASAAEEIARLLITEVNYEDLMTKMTYQMSLGTYPDFYDQVSQLSDYRLDFRKIYDFYTLLFDNSALNAANFKDVMIDRNYRSQRLANGTVSIAINPTTTTKSFQIIANYIKMPEVFPQFSYQVEYANGQLSPVISFDANAYKKYGNVVKAVVNLSSTQSSSQVSKFIVFVPESMYLMNYMLLPDNLAFKAISYDPQGNIASSFDSSLSAKYYEFDSFQRLIGVRNYKGEIINSYEYHIK